MWLSGKLCHCHVWQPCQKKNTGLDLYFSSSHLAISLLTWLWPLIYEGYHVIKWGLGMIMNCIYTAHNFCMYYRSNYGQMKSYESLRCDVCRCCECSAAVSSAVGIWLRRAWELDVRVWTLFENIERWSHIVMLSQSCAKIKSLSDMTKKGVQQSGNIFSKSTNIYKSCNRDLMWQYLEPYLHRTGSDRSS